MNTFTINRSMYVYCLSTYLYDVIFFCKHGCDNNKSARDNTKFVTEEVDKLMNKGCISPVTEKPYVVNPLTVAQS
jgi:hypothetical protein